MRRYPDGGVPAAPPPAPRPRAAPRSRARYQSEDETEVETESESEPEDEEPLYAPSYSVVHTSALAIMYRVHLPLQASSAF